MLNVSVFELKPIDGRKSFYGKAEIICVKGGCYLRSYDTIVAALDDSGKFIRYWWSYSPTTLRHVNAFLKLYGLPLMDKAKWESLPLNRPVWLSWEGGGK